MLDDAATVAGISTSYADNWYTVTKVGRSAAHVLITGTRLASYHAEMLLQYHVPKFVFA
ncbi:hypothetical protein [Corynebacterium sp. HS2168-gen11]|uniref:hypothetical protein n=1 Tax=Corynebacterium sp. HS2168-gen11 TaxID=2974027 RepID=UPI00216B2C4A|nr:hypothetical protein [Corynebacterium sp. HS2168-gen11]MCS4534836.1 hypothetical protein [Corynebacterium sp. HS2168-gen11]